MRLKIVFMGTPSFAVPTLEKLISSGYEIVGVITAPDRLGGRGRKTVIESPVKQMAIENNLKVLQPTNLKNKDFLSELAGLAANLQIVVAFRMLPTLVWDMPEYGTYNLHGSLLPKYRGAAPINWSIINGETETGVTFFKLKHKIDTGDMLLQNTMTIAEHENVGDIHDRMMLLAAETVLEGVQRIEQGRLKFIQQDDRLATKAPKIYKETCQIDFKNPVKVVYNLIRGLSPYPGAWCKIDGKQHKILAASYYSDGLSKKPGRILTDAKEYMTICCMDGYIHVQKLQQEGKRAMTIKEYLNGYSVHEDHVRYFSED